jgi:transposase
MDEINAFVGLDVHKDKISVAIAEAGRGGEVRLWGTIPNNGQAIDKVMKRLGNRHGAMEIVYEAGPCGYGIYRRLSSQGYTCRVVAPSRTPRRSGDRIKNDTRDAIALARLLRAGELSFVWVPDEVHEAMRDLVRARHSASNDVRRTRQRILSFLLRHGRRFHRTTWRYGHRIWLADQSFEHPAQQIAFQTYLNAEEQAVARRASIDQELARLLPHWSLAPVVDALQSLRGIGLIIAISIVAEIGDFKRFSNARQLMAFLGIVPGEHSSGSSVRPGGITKTGNAPLRALLFEAAWHYRLMPKVGSRILRRRPSASQAARDIAWKAQVRLNARYRHLVARGKRSQIAITAVARELVGFIWAIACSTDAATSSASA